MTEAYGESMSDPRRRQELGQQAVILSFLLWFALPLVPFLGLSASNAALTGAILFLGTEVLFWGGVALAGRQAVNEWKAKLIGRFSVQPAECSTGRLC